MTELLILFDTEDFTNEKAAKDARDVAQLLEYEGVTASFNVVGLLARQLRKWGQYGIAAALGRHEIQTHSLGHSVHPTICEYTDTEDYAQAHNRFIREERECLDELNKTFGSRPINAACPPGDSKSYVAMYGYPELGVPIYADTYVFGSDHGGMYFCGSFHLQYFEAMEDWFFADNYSEDDLLDTLATRATSILFNHPNRIGYGEFWDMLNYYKKNPPEGAPFIYPPRYREELIERFKARLRSLVRRVKTDPRFRLTKMSQVLTEEKARGERIITRDMLPELLRAFKTDDILIDAALPFTVSRSDIFAAAVEFLRGADEYKIALTRGFLDTPLTIAAGTTVSAADMKAAVCDIDVTWFIPEKITVGGVDMGAADFTVAALELLVDGGDTVVVKPRRWEYSLDRWPELRDCCFRGSWIHSDSLEDNYLSKRLRLQAWTLRERAPEYYRAAR